MALPKLDHPTLTMKVPSTQQEVVYRAFIVKEEKILMLAQEDGDPKAIARAVKQVLNNCIISGDVDIDHLASFDVDYMFLQLRARSVGETVDLSIPCEECETAIMFEVDLNAVEVKSKGDMPDPNIKLTDTVGIVLRWPEIDDAGDIGAEDKGEIEKAFSLIAACVEQIYDADNVYSKSDVSLKEIEEWLQDLTQEQFEKIRDFFDDMPKVVAETDIKCGKCSHKQKVTIEGMQNFFG